MKISSRLREVKPSVTLAITAKAKKLKDEGVDVVSFGAGEPDFPTPGHISKAGIEAIESGFTKYTPTTGIPQLKNAIVEKFKKDNNLSYEPSQIVVSCGAKHSLYNILQAICDQTDEVVIASPYWVSYPEMVKLAGAKAVIVDTDRESGFKLTGRKLKAVMNKRTKAVIINSPANPTGVVYSKRQLQELADVILHAKAFIISDEIYEKLIYDGLRHVSIASLSKAAFEKSFVVNGASKSYSMTGWRIGYAAGPVEVMQAIVSLQDHSTSNPCSISQKAALAAIEADQDCTEKMRQEFEKRRNYLMERIDKFSKLSYIKPRGAFYLFCDISKTRLSSMAFSESLLDEANVAVIPGISFGCDDFVRLSFATSMESIKKGMDRIEEWLARR